MIIILRTKADSALKKHSGDIIKREMVKKIPVTMTLAVVLAFDLI